MDHAKTSISSRLRQATSEAHQATSRAPFFRALTQRALPKHSAVAYFRGLAILHGVLERALLDFPAFWDVRLARLPALLSDLEACGAGSLPDIDPAIESALALSDAILASHGFPARLAGALYVLEDSMLGGQALCADFASALGVAGRPLAYFDAGKEGIGARWPLIQAGLDSFGEEDFGAMEQAAAAAFDGVAALAAACFPFAESSLRRRVTALNPEAGRHAMPQDEREIALALRAADKAWRRHPYLEARYGSRGRRFTLSDSCWLASLRSGGQDDVLRNLRWLAGLLAVRGLPSLILERHLESLDQEFESPVFAPAVADLRARRRSVLSDADYGRIVERWAPRLPDYGGAELLTNAIADEASGWRGAWESVRSWFADPVRFARERIQAVEDLGVEARTALR